MTLSTEQLDKLREMWENGCPTYEEANEWFGCRQVCFYCNQPQQMLKIDHIDCPWLTLEELFGKTNTNSDVRPAQEREDDPVQATKQGASSSGCE